MKNLKFAFRLLIRNPLLLYIGIPGLAVGLSAFLLLAVYLNYELSFDRHFANNGRVLRLCNKLYEEDAPKTLSIALRTAYTQLPSLVPEIEKATQLYPEWDTKVKTGNETFKDLKLLYVDPEFFDVFGLNLLQGNSAEALVGKSSVVLSKSIAKKIFGTENCIGEQLIIGDSPSVVTGVVNDIPKNTHFKFDILKNLESHEFIAKQGSLEFKTYYLIRKGVDLKQVSQNIASVNDNLMTIWKKRGALNNLKTETTTELLRNIHLHSEARGDLVPNVNRMQLLVVLGIGIFIFTIALINFINIYLLYGERRIAEIASRKVLGATKGKLALLFYSENGLIAIISLFLAMFLTVLVQPYFSEILNLPLTVSDMFTPWGVVIIITTLIVVVLISGIYPSLYLAKINLVSGLKGKHQNISRGLFSKSVVLVQFFITVLLICSLLVIRSQIKKLKEVPLGFNVNNVVMVQDFSREFRKNATNIKKELETLPFIQSIGMSEHSLGEGCSGQSIAQLNSSDEKPIKEYRVMMGFCEIMELQLKQGCFFDDSPSDRRRIILNESAAKMLGLEFTLGVNVSYKGEPAEVKGIVKNFYFDGYAGKEIDPLVICQSDNYASIIYIRYRDEFTTDNQKQVANVIKSFDPDFVMSSITLGDIYAAKFQKDEQVARMVSLGTLLAIILSFIGMLSLAVLNVDRRTKEVGIRKVAGSTEIEVMRKLIGESFSLVAVASVFAFGVSYYLMSMWLSNYSIRINLSIGYFLLGGFLAFIIVFMAVGWQSWRAATRNPVEALRYE
ncbi:MAG: FtsX-like permease family protein [Bacteroidales bacterium]